MRNGKLLRFLGLLFTCMLSIGVLSSILSLTKNESESPSDNPNGDLVVDTDTETASAIKLVKHNGVNSSGQNYVEVRARIDSNAINKDLNWELTWEYDSLYDDLGEPTDYVQMKVSSDKQYVTLTKNMQFEHTIHLNVRSVANEDLFACCTIDCYARPNSITCDINLSSLSGYAYDGEPIELGNLTYADILNGESFCETIIDFESIGTIETECTKTTRLELSEDFKELLLEYGYNNDNGYESYIFDDLTDDSNDDIYIMFILDEIIMNESWKEDIDFITAICDETTCWFVLVVEVNVIYDGDVIDTIVEYFDLNWEIEANVSPQYLVLDKTSHIF